MNTQVPGTLERWLEAKLQDSSSDLVDPKDVLSAVKEADPNVKMEGLYYLLDEYNSREVRRFEIRPEHQMLRASRRR